MVQWLRLRDYPAGGTGSIPGWGTKIPHAPRRGQKKKEREIIEVKLFAKAIQPVVARTQDSCSSS